MDANLFNEKAPGRLVKISTAHGPDWAFVPDPLPPELDLTGISKPHEEATLALGELKGLGRDIGSADLFVRPFVRREARVGSIIEGTVVEMKDLYLYEAGQLKLPGLEGDPREAALKEVFNYVKTIEYALEQDELPLSLRLVCKLHEILTTGVRGGEAEVGRFRRVQAGVRGEELNEAVFIAPPVPDMNVALAALENYLHVGNKYPQLIRLALIHYQFETIHPFRDGNGRIGRLLIHLMLVYWGILRSPLLYLSRYFEKNKTAYCNLLFNVSARGEWREWLLFFLEAVKAEAADTVKRIVTLQDLRSEWRQRISGHRVSALAVKLADSLIENPIISYKKAAEILTEDYKTAHYWVNKLVEFGIIKELRPRAYRKVFICEPVFETIFS